MVPEGDLSDYDIDFEVKPDPTKSDPEYHSKSGVDISFQGKAEAQKIPEIPQGTAGVSIKFSRESAIVLAFKGGVENRMASQEEVQRHIVGKAQSNEFPIDHAIVTHLYVCDVLSAIVSQSRNGELTVAADADFKAGVVDLANASLDLSVKSSRDLATQILATEGGTPMFRAIRLKRNFWQDVEVRGLESDAAAPQVFEDLTPATIDSAE